MRYSTVKNLDTAIAAIATDSLKHREKVQNVAVAILLHIHKCGDYRKANDLVSALGDGARRESLVQWFVNFCGLVVDKPAPGKKSQGFIGVHPTEGKGFITQDRKEKAMKEMWWTSVKASDGFKVFDANAKIASLLKQIKKHRKAVEGGRVKDGDKINVELNASTIQALANLINFEPIGTERADAGAANDTTEKPKAKRESA